MSDKEKKARPWDLFNKNIGRVSEEVHSRRMAICESCPEFFKATQQCKICLCIMPAKTKLPHSECPLHKWGKEIIPIDKEI